MLITLLFFFTYKNYIGYHNCLPLVQKYKTLTNKKEDLVQICVNKIEEKNEMDILRATGEKLAIKILMEDAELDLSSHKNENSSRHSINLEIPGPGLCKICYATNEKIQVGVCKHTFCHDCLKQYVENLINIGQAHIF